MAVNFTCTPQEQHLIVQIVARYSQMAEQFFGEALSDETKLNVQMDLTACHCNGCPLDLERLLDIRDFDFIHDVAGIRNNLDRTTGKLNGFFLPRLGLMDNHARERLGLQRTLEGLAKRGWVCRRWWDSEETHDFPEDATHEHIVEEAASVELCHLYFRKGEEKGTIVLVWGNSPTELIADVGGPAQFDTDLNDVIEEIWPNYPEE